jgi:chemotaxis protein MotA
MSAVRCRVSGSSPRSSEWSTRWAIDGPPSEIGEKVGAALVGTFLGMLMRYGFVQPLASGLEQYIADEGNYEQCIRAGLVALYSASQLR